MSGGIYAVLFFGSDTRLAARNHVNPKAKDWFQSVLEATTKELGDSVHFLTGDVSDRGTPKAIVDETIAKLE